VKTLIIILFVLFPLTGCFSQNLKNSSSGQQGSDKLLDSNVWDFGSIQKGQIVRHDFQVKNNLSRKLTINGVTTSCGCTASTAKKNILDPQESTQISVEFNSKGYKGETSQFVYVNTDDPDNPVIKFTFKAFVE